MGIGQRRPIELVQIVSAKDSAGRWQSSEGEVFQTWADVASVSGFREYQVGQTQLGETKTFQVRFRFNKYPNCDWKVRYDGKVWTVSEIEKVNEKQFYWLLRATTRGDV